MRRRFQRSCAGGRARSRLNNRRRVYQIWCILTHCSPQSTMATAPRRRPAFHRRSPAPAEGHAMHADRAGLNDGPDLLRRAGDTATSVSVADLLVDIPRVLRWCEPELSALGQVVPSERPRPPAVVEPLPRDGLACSPTNADSTTLGLQRPPEAGVVGGASGAGGSRHAGRGGGRVNWTGSRWRKVTTPQLADGSSAIGSGRVPTQSPCGQGAGER